MRRVIKYFRQKGGGAVEDDFWVILSKFAILGGAIEFAGKLIKLLPKLLKKIESLKIRRKRKR